MPSQTIKKDSFGQLIGAVTETGRFFGPQPRGNGVALTELGPSDEITFDYGNTQMPLKNWFFPRVEVIARHDADGITHATTPDTSPAVLFGVRPCETASLLLLDKIFIDGDVVDPYYSARRDCATIIALACNSPRPTCFCEMVGGAPNGSKGADVLAYDLGDVFLFDAVSAKGEAFMTAYAGVLSEASDAEIAARDQQIESVTGKASAPDIEGALKVLREGGDSDAWDDIAALCMTCGTCAAFCPTCHCFGLCDDGDDRLKVQHSCMLTGFTSEASGHNPRSNEGGRMRQRILHKFRYTPENTGEVFCVGCGRCIVNCPVNIDIRETLRKVVG